MSLSLYCGLCVQKGPCTGRCLSFLPFCWFQWSSFILSMSLTTTTTLSTYTGLDFLSMCFHWHNYWMTENTSQKSMLIFAVIALLSVNWLKSIRVKKSSDPVQQIMVKALLQINDDREAAIAAKTRFSYLIPYSVFAFHPNSFLAR